MAGAHHKSSACPAQQLQDPAGLGTLHASVLPLRHLPRTLQAWADPDWSITLQAGQAVSSTLARPVSAATQAEDFACPFCALLCDDLTLETPSPPAHPPRNACPRASAGYAAAEVTGAPHVGGKPVTLEVALKAATKLLRASKRPLFHGLGSDVQGLRALFRLAEHCGAMVDHMHSEALNSSLRVLQSRGWHTTTLGEVQNRADLVVILGVDLDRGFPRFLERHVAGQHALQPARRTQRRLVYLGPKANAPTCATDLPLDILPTRIDRLAESLRTLQGLVQGVHLPSVTKSSALHALAARISAAEYPVFVWAPGQLPALRADLVISAACELVAQINRTRRAAGLALGGDDGAQSALAVSAWLTGFGTGVGFSRGALRPRGEQGGSTAALAEGGIDLLLHLSSFSQACPPATDKPSIVLAPPGFAPREAPDVYLPIGIPGIDHAGQLIRTDGVVALPLRALRVPRHPDAAAVLQRLQSALERKP